MANKGILYVMTTIVDGIVKIGKTGSDNFENRMSYLEKNGYANMPGLRRNFAIEVEDYDKKEKLLHNTFEAGRAANTELFAADINRVKELMAALDGKIVYPKTASKEAEFVAASDAVQETKDKFLIPDGVYTLNSKKTNFGPVNATMKVEDHKFTVLAGSTCCPISMKNPPAIRINANVEDDKLIEDVECSSPSTASTVVLGSSSDGWKIWKNEKGESIDVYRTKAAEEDD